MLGLVLVGLAATAAGGAAAEPPIYVDATEEVGLDFVHFNGMSGKLYFSEMMGSGAALLDYDGDGDLDAYLVQGHMLGDEPIERAVFPPRHPLPLTDRLYRNDLGLRADGTVEVRFVDATEASGIRAGGYGMGVAAGDIDNDGWVDLYVTNHGPNQMWRNQGDGTFSDVTERSGTGDPRWGVSAAFVDYDRDGWLDLYVGNYVDFRLAIHKQCASASGMIDYCGPLAFRPEPDRLYRNRGDGTFEDVSRRAGIHEEDGGALGVVAADVDADGWPDVYVANDQVPNILWINQRDGTFSDNAVLAGCAVDEQGRAQASMGVVLGDLDGDGDDDLFMSHLTRETNTLYLGDGGGLFADATRGSGLGAPSFPFTGFGVSLSDYDNDGWLDLYVANGTVTRIEEQLAAGDPFPLRQTDQLFRALGGGRFEEVTARAGEALERSEVSRGVATGDVDNDGDPDLLVANNSGPARLLRNEVGQSRRWIGARLIAGRSGGELTGARVLVRRRDGVVLGRRAATDGSYASANDPRVLAGLGDGGESESLTVAWPDGRTTRWTGLPAGRYVNLVRPAPEDDP